jgi:CheY-like chemotaxis protein
MIGKVAIVDDDSIFQFTTKIKIEKGKLATEVLFFNDGEEIINYISNTPPNQLPELILLDINMPIIDGWDFINFYKEVPKAKRDKIKIFMISSSINPDDVRRAEESPFISDYITKPIKDKDLSKIFS